jgi:hypothetical protein
MQWYDYLFNLGLIVVFAFVVSYVLICDLIFKFKKP